MLTRRHTLLASAMLAAGAPSPLPAAAQQRLRPASGATRRARRTPADRQPRRHAARPGRYHRALGLIRTSPPARRCWRRMPTCEMPPSSMTKLMTIYLVYERLKQGRLQLDDELPVSERAWRMGGSKMFVQVGTQVKVEDLIRGVIVQSGNDACIVFAEAIAGSEEQFAELMNQKAKELGLTNSQFQEFHRLARPGAAHELPRHRHAGAADHPRLPGILSLRRREDFKYNNIEQGNRNPLVQKGTADGLKTGHTEAGGYGLVASSQARRPAGDPGAERPEVDAPARRGGRAADGLGVREFRGRDAVRRRRRGRACAGLAGHVSRPCRWSAGATWW